MFRSVAFRHIFRKSYVQKKKEMKEEVATGGWTVPYSKLLRRQMLPGSRRRIHSVHHHFRKVCIAKMNLSDEVDLEDYVSRSDKFNAVKISATWQEATMHAVRKNIYVILLMDFEKACSYF
ncbi:26S protease regulatory subunit 6 [Artemisia annua]|uniref:26S protease regulatory subunit 6 n=1 Tax=Artemisia annua TaxID=35608 RepID=A0A2U1NFX2_ARTAN|nr:26S protease regulatory subunit 6 [Artemisia annua]